jgi:hypothetical protein
MFDLFTGNLSPSLADTISVNGVAFNLTGSSVQFKMRPTNSATLTVNAAAVIVNAVAGQVRYDWQSGDTAAAGLYAFWWSVTLPGGDVQDTPESDLQISNHAIAANALCTLTDIHLAMETPVTDTSMDDIAQEYINEASELIGKTCYRQFAPIETGISRTFLVNSSGRATFGIHDLQSATTVILHPETTNPVTVASTDYQLEPWVQPDGVYTAIRISPWIPLVSLRQLKFGRAELQITGTWGYPTIPEPVKRACVVTVRSWLRKDAQAMAGSAVSGYYSGQELPAALPTTYALPAAALRMLNRYQKTYGFV